MIYLKGARSDSPDSFFGLPTRAELAALRAELQTSGVQESVLRAQLQVPGLQGIDIHPDTPHTSVEGLLRSLSPFRYSSTQDSRVESIALGIVQDPTFIDLEARAINPYVSAEPNASPQRLAEARYDTVIVDALPNRMASLSWTRGLEYIRGLDHTGELEHSGRLIYTKSLQADTPESIHSVSEQIDRVDFCPAQIRGTIETGKVRDAYVDGVSERVESINTGKL